MDQLFWQKSTFCWLCIKSEVLLTYIELCYIFFVEGLDSFPVKPSIIVGLSSESIGPAACLASLELVGGGLAEVFINQQPHPSLYVLVKSSGFHISNKGFPKCNDKQRLWIPCCLCYDPCVMSRVAVSLQGHLVDDDYGRV